MTLHMVIDLKCTFLIKNFSQYKLVKFYTTNDSAVIQVLITKIRFIPPPKKHICNFCLYASLQDNEACEYT